MGNEIIEFSNIIRGLSNEDVLKVDIEKRIKILFYIVCILVFLFGIIQPVQVLILRPEKKILFTQWTLGFICALIISIVFIKFGLDWWVAVVDPHMRHYKTPEAGLLRVVEFYLFGIIPSICAAVLNTIFLLIGVNKDFLANLLKGISKDFLSKEIGKENPLAIMVVLISGVTLTSLSYIGLWRANKFVRKYILNSLRKEEARE
jgi:hypothetical protein